MTQTRIWTPWVRQSWHSEQPQQNHILSRDNAATGEKSFDAIRRREIFRCHHQSSPQGGAELFFLDSITQRRVLLLVTQLWTVKMMMTMTTTRSMTKTR